MAVDPVCTMDVEPAKAAAQSSYKGQTYYFCAVGCKQKFDREPETYLKTLSRRPSWRGGTTTSG